MLVFKKMLWLILLVVPTCLDAKNLHSAITKPVPVNDLNGFDHYPPKVKELILEAKKLSEKNLTYLYGSADPKNKGMDCSGTIKYLLKQKNIESPRQANELYLWVEKHGGLHKVKPTIFGKESISHLKPGDLLFWTGTYKVKRTPPITHVMLYLGKDKNNRPLMFGSTNGLSYKKKPMYGVSVFDFTYPHGSSGKLVGYGCIPQIGCHRV